MTHQPGTVLDALVAKAIGRDITKWTGEGDLYDWSPSTNANAALEAAEIMFRDFYIWHNDSGSCYHASVSFTRCIEEDCKFREIGDTMPHAICLAILAAKGEK